MEKSFSEQLSERMAAMPPEEKAEMRRITTGEADGDLLTRKEIWDVCRQLRLDPVKSHEYQRALTDVMRQISKLKGIRS